MIEGEDNINTMCRGLPDVRKGSGSSRKPISALARAARMSSLRWLMVAVVATQVVGCKKAEAAVDAGSALTATAPAKRRAEVEASAVATGTRTPPKVPQTVVGPSRPRCVLPPRILTPERAHLLGGLSEASLGWVLGLYEESGGDGGAGDADSSHAFVPESVESDYLSELAPAKRVRLVPTGLARVVAVRHWWETGRKRYKLLKTGVLSDHCILAFADESQLLFSLMLSDDLVVQAVVERAAEPLVDHPLVEPDGEPIPRAIYARLTQADREVLPITSVRIRVVRKTSAGQMTISETQQIPSRAPTQFGLHVTALVLGDTEEAAVAIGFPHLGAVAVVTRDGRIPFVHEKLCAAGRAVVAISRSKLAKHPHRLIVAEAEPNGRIGAMCREQAEVDASSDAWRLPSPPDAGPPAGGRVMRLEGLSGPEP